MEYLILAAVTIEGYGCKLRVVRLSGANGQLPAEKAGVWRRGSKTSLSEIQEQFDGWRNTQEVQRFQTNGS